MNSELLDKLYNIGKLPTEDIADEIDFPLNEFDGLLQQFTLPISVEECIKIINLSPPVGEGCYGLEWALIHLAESVDVEQLQYAIDHAEDGEVKQIIQMRLNNYNNKK